MLGAANGLHSLSDHVQNGSLWMLGVENSMASLLELLHAGNL